MDNTRDLLEKWKAGDYDALLSGTKYANKYATNEWHVDIESRTQWCDDVPQGKKDLHTDATTNAARVQVLEALLAEAEKALQELRITANAFDGFKGLPADKQSYAALSLIALYQLGKE